MILSSAAYASDWVRFRKDTELVCYYDRESIVTHGDMATVWLKTLEKQKNQIIRILIRMNIRKDHTWQKVYGIAYDEKGNEITSDDKPDKWQDIIPDSGADEMYHILFPSDVPLPKAGG